MVFGSTCWVYGDSQKEMMKEESKTFAPVSLYGATKLKSENAIKGFAVDYTILRMGTLFGLSPRMRFDLVINLFVAKAMNKEKLTVFGGQQYRPFLHLLDAADAFAMAVENGLKGTFNVSWKNYKLIDIAMELKEKLDVEMEVSENIVDKRNYFVDTGKIESAGFKAKRDISFFIEEMKKFRRIKDYKNPVFSNFGSLLNDVEKQRKIYTLGPLSERP